MYIFSFQYDSIPYDYTSEQSPEHLPQRLWISWRFTALMLQHGCMQCTNASNLATYTIVSFNRSAHGTAVDAALVT